MTIKEALYLIETSQSLDTLEACVQCYNKSLKSKERLELMSKLKELYYTPHETTLSTCYQNNVQLLMSYPYIWDKSFTKFSDLDFLLFSTGSNYYYVYDKQQDLFTGKYDATSEHQMRYFFKNLAQALKVENEDNLYNLTFLFDNVRRSEDVAMDNHIYLLYNSWQPLQRLMQIGDLASILDSKKFVFFIGAHNHSRYPIDFKAEFGIDYASMTPQIVQPEEIKRISYGWLRPTSGAILSNAIFDKNPYLSVWYAPELCRSFTLNDMPIAKLIGFNQFVQSPDTRFTFKNLLDAYNHPRCHWQIPTLQPFIDWLGVTYGQDRTYSVLDIFKLHFMFLDHENKNWTTSRIVPLLVFDPHTEICNQYEKLILAFPYHMVMHSVRNPIMALGRSINYHFIYPEGDYTRPLLMCNELRKRYFAFRFEDLKRYPEATLKKICETLNVPFDRKMLDIDVPFVSTSNGSTTIVRGFDQTPLHHNLDSVFSEFDQLRLKIYFLPIIKYFKYDESLLDESPMSDVEFIASLEQPFRFEYNLGKSKEEAKRFRIELFNRMKQTWLTAKARKIVLPKVIYPDPETDESNHK